jgi:hypothetical protein
VVHLTIVLGVPRTPTVIDVRGDLRTLFGRNQAFQPGEERRTEMVWRLLRRASSALGDTDPDAMAGAVSRLSQWPDEP